MIDEGNHIMLLLEQLIKEIADCKDFGNINSIYIREMHIELVANGMKPSHKISNEVEELRNKIRERNNNYGD